MGNNRPLNTKCWEKYLTYKGFKYKKTESSHDIWVKPGCRPIPVWGNEKEIPAMHLHTSARTIGVNRNDIYEWAKDNC